MPTKLRCRKCGLPITLGWVQPPGQFAIRVPLNFEDQSPHGKRCREAQTLRRAKRWSAPKDLSTAKQQPSLPRSGR